MDENLHDKIAKLSYDCFSKLPKTGKPNSNEWTVLSSFIWENESKFEVVALGTGSKCIGRNSMSKTGQILNDSHAEIVARRAFLRYCYENLTNENVFTKTGQLLGKIHFFTSLMPCGDASIFPKQNEELFGSPVLSNYKRKVLTEKSASKKPKMDSYRTGAKCLEDNQQDPKQSEDYHVLGVVRTKPGRGDPTLSVSCSDKIAKWCSLGVQGALLSLLLQPIYLTSFTVAGQTPFSLEALKRSFYFRLGETEGKMIIGQSLIGFEFQKNEQKLPCPSSIVFYKSNERKVQVAVKGKRQGVTKRMQLTEGAQLDISRQELFKCFIKNYPKENCATMSYHDAKTLSQSYNAKWANLKEKFGCWTEKNSNLLDFKI